MRKLTAYESVKKLESNALSIYNENEAEIVAYQIVKEL